MWSFCVSVVILNLNGSSIFLWATCDVSTNKQKRSVFAFQSVDLRIYYIALIHIVWKWLATNKAAKKSLARLTDSIFVLYSLTHSVFFNHVINLKISTCRVFVFHLNCTFSNNNNNKNTFNAFIFELIFLLLCLQQMSNYIVVIAAAILPLSFVAYISLHVEFSSLLSFNWKSFIHEKKNYSLFLFCTIKTQQLLLLMISESTINPLIKCIRVLCHFVQFIELIWFSSFSYSFEPKLTNIINCCLFSQSYLFRFFLLQMIELLQFLVYEIFG